MLVQLPRVPRLPGPRRFVQVVYYVSFSFPRSLLLLSRARVVVVFVLLIWLLAVIVLSAVCSCATVALEVAKCGGEVS